MKQGNHNHCENVVVSIRKKEEAVVGIGRKGEDNCNKVEKRGTDDGWKGREGGETLDQSRVARLSMTEVVAMTAKITRCRGLRKIIEQKRKSLILYRIEKYIIK